MSDFLTWVVFNWNHQCLTGLCCFLFLKTWHIVTYWLISQDLIWICSHCQMLPNSFLFYIAASNPLFQPHHETSQANQPNPPNQPNQPNQLKPAQPATVNPWFWNWPITPPTPPMEEKLIFLCPYIQHIKVVEVSYFTNFYRMFHPDTHSPENEQLAARPSKTKVGRHYTFPIEFASFFRDMLIFGGGYT